MLYNSLYRISIRVLFPLPFFPTIAVILIFGGKILTCSLFFVIESSGVASLSLYWHVNLGEKLNP